MEKQKKEINMVNAFILDKNNHAILIHNCKEYGEVKNNRWEFPGGKVEESDKSFEKATIREVEEELRIKIKIIKRDGKRILGDYETDTPEGKFYCRTFNAEIAEGNPEIMESKKADRFDYFSYNNLSYLNEQGVLAPNLVLSLTKLKKFMK